MNSSLTIHLAHCLSLSLWLCSACNTLPENDFTLHVCDSLSIELVYVKGGSFEMGGEFRDSLAYSWEYPAHQVTLSDYYIAKNEITIDQFHRFVTATGYTTDASRPPGGHIYGIKDGKRQWSSYTYISYLNRPNKSLRPREEYNHPALFISWNDAVAFCEWASTMTGKKVVLPTEAQWEFAARGGNKSKHYLYSGSDSIAEVTVFQKVTHNKSPFSYPVGSLRPNELGIYDMSGNASEWCSDFYSDYNKKEQYNPTGPKEGEYRVVRGGAWGNGIAQGRVTNRNHYSPSYSNFSVGFRVAVIP